MNPWDGIAGHCHDLFVPPATWQINVVVGAFFVISGYVAAYTTTALGQTLGRSYGGGVHNLASEICGNLAHKSCTWDNT